MGSKYLKYTYAAEVNADGVQTFLTLYLPDRSRRVTVYGSGRRSALQPEEYQGQEGFFKDICVHFSKV
jgi:hypothetical protein